MPTGSPVEELGNEEVEAPWEDEEDAPDDGLREEVLGLCGLVEDIP